MHKLVAAFPDVIGTLISELARMGRKDAADVVAFLESEYLEELIDLAHLDIAPDAIRSGLGLEN